MFQDAPERFTELGIAPIMWAYEQLWPIRRRAGSWDPGHAALREGAVSGAAEGGLGKIMIELGIPGLFVVGWLAILVFNSSLADHASCIAKFTKDSPTFLWSFQFSRGQRGGVLGCHAGVWRLVHIVDLELDARFPFGGSGTA